MLSALVLCHGLVEWELVTTGITCELLLNAYISLRCSTILEAVGLLVMLMHQPHHRFPLRRVLIHEGEPLLATLQRVVQLF